MYRKSCGCQTTADAKQPIRHDSGQPGHGAAEPPGLIRWQRCSAALIADPRPCGGGPTAVRVVDRTGQGTTACQLHGAVLLASLDGALLYSLDGGNTMAGAVHHRAGLMRPFGGVWTGPGVQRVTTLDEAMVLPSAPNPAESRSRSSEPGNAPGRRWVPGRRYQAGHSAGGAAGSPRDGARGTWCKEVATR